VASETGVVSGAAGALAPQAAKREAIIRTVRIRAINFFIRVHPFCFPGGELFDDWIILYYAKEVKSKNAHFYKFGRAYENGGTLTL
jgi:hypothetical protein